MTSTTPGKKVCVLGLGKTGTESALFLKRSGFQVFVSEGNRSLELLAAAEPLLDAGIEVEVGSHDLKKIFNSDWVLNSPGISPSQKISKILRREKIPWVSEIEAASWFTKTENVIAVTGTAGKTTVTTLIAQLLERAGQKVHLCGNIGNPWIREVDQIASDEYVVVEVSSFQLASCSSFRPKIGILLNLSPNHLDWHPDMNDYVHSKLKLFQSQIRSDRTLIRKSDQDSFFPEISFRSKVEYFDEDKAVNPNEEVVRRVAALLGLGTGVAGETFAAFKGIEHRLDKLTVADGVTYINDSKCTTPASLRWALSQFSDQRVILIAGGKPKSADFDELAELVKLKVKTAVLIGQGRSILEDAWKDVCVIEAADNFRAAVEIAHRNAKAGDVVLLSPACASFDMFKNYEERGQVFAKIVGEVTSQLSTDSYVERG